MTIEELRIVISAKTEKLQEGIDRATSRLKDFGKSSNETSAKMGGNVKNIEKKLESLNDSFEKTQAQIEETKKELDGLHLKQNEIRDSYSFLPATSGMSKSDAIDTLLKKDADFQKLSDEIIKLESRLQPLIEKNRQTKKEAERLSKALEEVGNSAKNTGNELEASGGKSQKLGKSLQETQDSISGTRSKIVGFANMVDNAFKRILRRIFIFNVIYKIVRGFIGHIGAALSTNNEFVRSLSIIRTNLYVAFQPIYDFVLPALNALMRGIATVTTYIAAAISALFGKTYQQSFNAAKGVKRAKDEMKGLGGATRKAGQEAKGALMPFDEINNLDLDKGSATGGGGEGAADWAMEMPELATVELNLEKVKQKLKGIVDYWKSIGKLFKPGWDALVRTFKDGINTMIYFAKPLGDAMIDIWRRARESFESNIIYIADSFNAVALEIESAFADVFERIRSNAEPFAQNIRTIAFSIFDAFDTILPPTIKLLENFTIIMIHIYKGMVLTLLDVSFALVDGMAKVIEPGLMLVANIFKTVFGSINTFMEEHLRDITDVIDTTWANISFALTTIINGIADVFMLIFGGLLEWWKDNQQSVHDVLVKNWTTIWKAIEPIWQIINDIARNMFEGLKMFFANNSQAIADLIVSAWNLIWSFIGPLWSLMTDTAIFIFEGLRLFWDNWGQEILEIFTLTWKLASDAFRVTLELLASLFNIFANIFKGDWAATWEETKNLGSIAWNGIKTILNGIWDIISKISSTIWTGIKELILRRWGEIREGITGTKDKLIDAIKTPFRIAKDWIGDTIGDAFNWGKNLIGNIVDGINSMIGRVRDAVSNVAGIIGDFLGFSSPTKKGPGSKADKWMPNFMEMMADGIEDNIYEVSAAVNMTAGTLQSVQPSTTDDIATAVGNAMLAVIQADQGAGDSGEREVIIELDGVRLGRVMLPRLNQEADRLGYKPILKID